MGLVGWGMNETEVAAKLDEKFLGLLVESARTVGWGVGDYIPVRDFVRQVFDLAGKTPPTNDELEPYE